MKHKNSSDNQTIEYTHTIVPASMRSPYWKYFGFPSNSVNKILTRQKIICNICGTAITYNKNTSNLRTHLIARHPQKLHEIHHSQREQRSDLSAGNNSGGNGDTDGALADVISEMEEEGFKSHKLRSLKHSNVTSTDGCSVLKIRRLNANCRDSHEIELFNAQELSGVRTDVTGNCWQECDHQQQQNLLPKAEQLQMRESRNESCNDIQDKESTYELLSSDALNDLTNVKDAYSNCDDIDAGNLENEVDEMSEVDSVLPSSENTQKSVLDYYSDSSVSSTAVPKKSDCEEYTETSKKELIVDMLINDLLPINLLQGLGFRQLLSSLGFDNVDKDSVERKILTDYKRMKNTFEKYIAINLLRPSKPYSLSIENFRNYEEKSILSIYVNFISDIECKLESILLDEISCTNYLDLNHALQVFNLKLCAAIVTNDENNKIIQDFAKANSITVISCLEATLIRCLSIIFNQNTVSELFHRISKLNEQLNFTEVETQCPWSKLKCLQEFVDSSIASDLSCYKEIVSQLEPFLIYIKPLKITFDTINSEQIPLCSIVRPLIMKLFDEHFLIFNTEGNPYIQAAQKVISTELRDSIVKCSYYSEAMLFDARFQHEFILADTQAMQHEEGETFGRIIRSEITAGIYQRFRHRILEPSLNKKLEQNQSTMPKSGLRSFFQRISDVASASNRKNVKNTYTEPSNPKKGIDLEFDRYKCEPTLDLEQCPITWWKLRSHQFESLSKISNYYLCVPCYTPRWRGSLQGEVEINDRHIWWQKRKAIRHQHPVEKCLWYLRYNYLLHKKIKSNPMCNIEMAGKSITFETDSD